MEIKISLSALPPSLYRQYVKGWNKERYADLFRKYTGDRNNYRIHIPLVAGPRRIAYAPVPQQIQQSVADKGYTVEDYINGIAVDSTGRRRVRIGKLLPPELQKVFAEDKTRSNAKKAAQGNQMVVISRHPYDIAGMSTDRGWISCMNLIAGSNAKYVMDDVRQGSIIAYLVNKDDINLQRPSGRILLRVYRAENGKRGLFPSGIYGARSQQFFDTVRKWCSEVNNTYFGIPYGMTMELLGDLYNDGRMQVVNDNYDPATALKELEESLRNHPENGLRELDHFESRFGSDISEFYTLANSLKIAKLDAKIAHRAVRKIRILLEDKHDLDGYSGAAQIAARQYVSDAGDFDKADALALLRVSAVAGNKLLSMADGMKVAATLARVEDLSMTRIYTYLMEGGASRALLDAAPKFGLTAERAIGIMVADTKNAWHRVPLSKSEVKLMMKTFADEGVDELPPYYVAALAPASKMPALFKKQCTEHHYAITRGQTTGRAHNPDLMQLLIERMPQDKWATAFRGIDLSPLLFGSTFSRDTDPKALQSMEPFLAQRVAAYIKSDTKHGNRMLRFLLPFVGSLHGPQYGRTFFESISDDLWLEPAAALLGLEALMNGSGSRAEHEAELGLSQWIAASPIRVMALSSTEAFSQGALQSVVQAIESDLTAYRKMVAIFRAAHASIRSFPSHCSQSFPIVLAAQTVADYVDEATEEGIDIQDKLKSVFGFAFPDRVVKELLNSGLADL